MYFHVYNKHNEKLGRLVANNLQDAEKFAKNLYPTYSHLLIITHQTFHDKV